MAVAPDPFVAHCLELLAGLGAARSRRMFGGHGLYVDELFIAIVSDGVLYLKVDAQTRPQFEAARCEPFVYNRRESAVALGYWSAPEAATDSPAQMAPWARLAMAAALRARVARLTPAGRAATTRRRRGRP